MVTVNPVLVALDLGSAEEAVRLAKSVQPHVGGFKIGLGLLHGRGPAAVAALVALGSPVFVDAKLHDIPSQVNAAARQLGRLGARWVTAHVSGGQTMLEAAAEGVAETTDGAGGILGVSVLTSLDEAALAAIGFGTTPGKLVSRLAKLAAKAGCEGLICSPQELGVVSSVAPNLLKVTPGIRPTGSAADDQRRVATPETALAKGADYLVIGRPITGASDPVAAASEIAVALQGVDLAGGSG